MHAYRLLELEPGRVRVRAAPDAPLVGRKRELAALRRTLKRAVDGSAVRGRGRRRLAGRREVAARGRARPGARRASRSLWGRCLSYGEGITYWPLREVLEQADESDERDAVLAALDAETPPPAPELAWLFRRFCEASARERPLVLVFDDVHWAEPTFLELVEHLADKGTGPIPSSASRARSCSKTRPAFLEATRERGSDRARRALRRRRRDALLDGLGGD